MVTVESNQNTVRVGFLDPTAPAVVEVPSGAQISYPNTWTHWGNGAVYGMSFAEREPLRHQYPDGPFSLVGPVNVEGAQVGESLEVKIDTIKPISWGWNSSPKGVGALPTMLTSSYLHYFKFDDDRKQADFVKGVEITLRPFVGYIAAEPSGQDKTSANFAGVYGGNIDFPELIEGTSIFLPVAKPGGRLWVGNINGGQADGAVDQTGIETAAELLELTVSRHAVSRTFPIIETPTHWIIIGYSQENLDQALQTTLRQVIQWLGDAAGLEAADAYALSSMVVDFSVTQYADQQSSAYQTAPPKAIHAKIPKSVFSPDLLRAINIDLRGPEQ